MDQGDGLPFDDKDERRFCDRSLFLYRLGSEEVSVSGSFSCLMKAGDRFRAVLLPTPPANRHSTMPANAAPAILPPSGRDWSAGCTTRADVAQWQSTAFVRL